MTDKIRIETDRQLLLDAQNSGKSATLAAFFRLSGPGWLQSAITLGGGSLSGALFLGVLGGVHMLWLQMLAITFGVIMLSAISYVTLSTGERPLQAINRHINPALGWGWVIATVMANIIWCMPQFGLCYESLEQNLAAQQLAGSDTNQKLMISVVILIAAFVIVMLNNMPGRWAKVFDWILKLMVGVVVVCFFGVVLYLTFQAKLDWSAIFAGFIPDFNQFNQPTGELAELVGQAPKKFRKFWSDQLVSEQRNVLIAAAATAVGINMTFLLPYSLLSRGWDKTFRGLARFDLLAGLAIPYILVTSCVVIASAYAFHGTVDKSLASQDAVEIQSSSMFSNLQPILEKRIVSEHGDAVFDGLDKSEKSARVAELGAQLDPAEMKLASSLVRRNAFQLSRSLSPFLGDQTARLIFGIGVFAMGFTTIIILMMINGFAICEIFGRPDDKWLFAAGCLIAGIAGTMWPYVWAGESRFWLTILASVFGMMLLPIAYITFFCMINSRSLMADEKPSAAKMTIWNILMVPAVLGAILAAGTAIYSRMNDSKSITFIITLAIVYGILVVVGFFVKRTGKQT